jgi:hypothetical protein
LRGDDSPLSLGVAEEGRTKMLSGSWAAKSWRVEVDAWAVEG